MLRQNHQRRSRLQEKRAARDYGGVTQPGSGNGWANKADVITNQYLIECKTTTKESYSIKFADLSKLAFQAMVENKDPVFEIESAGYKQSFVVIPKDDFIA